MAKKSIIAREKLKAKIVKRCASARAKIKAAFKSAETYDDKMAELEKLQKQPRNASPSRGQKRCRACGRPKGVYRKFGLCRVHLREALMRGDVPGGRKASW